MCLCVSPSAYRHDFFFAINICAIELITSITYKKRRESNGGLIEIDFTILSLNCSPAEEDDSQRYVHFAPFKALSEYNFIQSIKLNSEVVHRSATFLLHIFHTIDPHYVVGETKSSLFLNIY